MSKPVDTRIDGFLSEFEPAIESQLRQARQLLRARFPHGFELVFNTYYALVFGISPTERSRDSFISVAGYPRWVTLFFLNGALLADPAGLLAGAGKQVRGIRLSSASAFSTPAVKCLVAQAAQPYLAELSAAPPLSTIIKAEAAKRRPRRAGIKTRGDPG